LKERLQDGEFTGLWIPTHLVIDAETDDALSWLILEHIHRKQGTNLHVLIQLPLDSKCDGLAAAFECIADCCISNITVFRDKDSSNGRAVESTWLHMIQSDDQDQRQWHQACRLDHQQSGGPYRRLSSLLSVVQENSELDETAVEAAFTAGNTAEAASIKTSKLAKVSAIPVVFLKSISWALHKCWQAISHICQQTINLVMTIMFILTSRVVLGVSTVLVVIVAALQGSIANSALAVLSTANSAHVARFFFAGLTIAANCCWGAFIVFCVSKWRRSQVEKQRKISGAHEAYGERGMW